MSIEGHKMTMTAADGADTIPYPGIDTVQLHSAERYDVIIEANQAVGNYWYVCRLCATIYWYVC